MKEESIVLLVLITSLVMFAAMLCFFFYICLKALKAPAEAPQAARDFWVWLEGNQAETEGNFARILDMLHKLDERMKPLEAVLNGTASTIETMLKDIETEVATVKALVIRPGSGSVSAMPGHGGVGSVGGDAKDQGSGPT